MSDITLDALATEIRQRMDGLGTQLTEATSDDRLLELVRTNLETLLANPDNEFVRKMRFAGAGRSDLVGTKYARLGLDVSDVEMLHDIVLAGQAIGRSSGPSEELTRTFAAISEGRYVDTAMVRADDERHLADMLRTGQLTRAAYESAVRAMDTADSGYGLQLIGAQYVGSLWEAARRDSRVFNLVDSFEMTQATAYLPVEVDIPEMLFVSENTSDSATSDYTPVKTGSQRVQVTPAKFMIHQIWSGEMEEDSIIPFLPFLRRQAALSMAYYSDSLVLNGDNTNAATGNINLVDADPADTKHYLAFDGVRHASLVDNTANSANVAGSITLSQLNKQRGRMIDAANKVDWGHPTDPSDLVYVSDPETGDRIALLDEVITVDKYGPQASVLTGEQSKILGHPHITSIAMSKTDATGNVSTTGSNNVKGQVAAFNRRGFKVGWRRHVQVETERMPGRDQSRIVYSLRLGLGRFTPTGAASGIEATDVLYNISL